jgi:hypothetical protein
MRAVSQIASGTAGQKEVLDGAAGNAQHDDDWASQPERNPMKAAIALLLMILLAGCTNRPPQTSTPPATAPDPPTQTSDVSALLNVVITDWLNGSPDGIARAGCPRVVVLLGENLPPGFAPTVPGWTLLVVPDTDPHAPPRRVRAGDVLYVFTYHSSYDAKEKLQIVHAGEKPLPPPTRTEEITEPVVLRIDAIRLHGDAGDVEISQNRHHNLGGAGTTYKVQRSPQGWQFQRGQTWMS